MTIPHILNAMQERNILVIGDLMLDHYIWGDVHRISPEAPVPVVNASHESHTAGGAANVALNLASLGVQVRLAGALGKDAAGDRLLGLLGDAGIDTALCRTDESRPTIIKTRVIVRNQQLCRIDHEAATSTYALECTTSLLNTIESCDAVILSDYAKGVISQPLLEALIAHAKQHGKTISLDPKPSRKLNFHGTSLITPNRHEALELAGLAEPGIGEPYPLEQVCQNIHDRHSPELRCGRHRHRRPHRSPRSRRNTRGRRQTCQPGRRRGGITCRHSHCHSGRFTWSPSLKLYAF